MHKIRKINIVCVFVIYQVGRASPGLPIEQLMQGINHTDVQSYLDLMIEVAEMCGANTTKAEDEMLKVLEFEQSLAEVLFDQISFYKPIDSIQFDCLRFLFRFYHTLSTLSQ